MRCNKCGAQCDENQAFCLMCGSPLQISADFNQIEQELASSIDELMNEIEIDSDEATDVPEEDIMKTIDVPIEEINMGLKVVDIKRQQDMSIDLLMDDEEDTIDPIILPTERPAKKQPPKEIREPRQHKESRETREPNEATRKPAPRKKKKNSNAKLYAIVGIVAVFIAILAVVLILVLGGAKDIKQEKFTFDELYAQAEEFYNGKDMDKALEKAIAAKDMVDAKNGAEEIKARKLIHKIYNDLNYTGQVFLDNIEELIALGDTSEDYYQSLFAKYYEAGNTDMLRALIESVGEEQAEIYLGEGTVQKPTSTASSGQHKNVLVTELKAEEGCEIYYVINGKIDSEAQKYEAQIEILKAGDYKIEAYAVSANGIPSATASFNFSIVEGEAEAPTVTPGAGTYSEETFITIVVPEGGTAYYTYDGTEPTTSSTEYTEPVEMLRGNNVFKAIVVDKYGIVSAVTTKTYILKLKRNETPTSGEDKVWGTLEQAGTIDKDGYTATGTQINVSYEDAAEIDGDEYYIYIVTETSVDGTSTTTLSYTAVNTHTGEVIEGVIEAAGEYILPEVEEVPATGE